VENRRNLYAITLPPPFGSLIDSDSLTAGETGLNSIPPGNWPPVVIPFFSFRIMVGCGLVMLGLAWLGTYLGFKHRLERNRLLLWLTFLSFPLPFIAILTGWFTAEVGRQPWVVYGVLRTADAMTPFLTTRAATISLLIFCMVYAFIFAFGTFYIYRLIHTGPVGKLFEAAHATAVPSQTDVAGQRRFDSRTQPRRRWRIAMVMFWVLLLAISILLYVLLDGVDLGVGMLFRVDEQRNQARRHAERRRADLGRQRDLAGGRRGDFVGSFSRSSMRRLLSAFYLPLIVMLLGLILRGVAFEFRDKTQRMRWIWDLSFAGGSLIATFIQGLTVGRPGGRVASHERPLFRW